MIILIVSRLWLVEAQDFLATFTPHDDYLFVRLARHILSGEWLGPYNQLTLVKGPVYPLFIAVVHHMGIPLQLAQHLLYSIFCVLAIVALRPLVRQQWPFMIVFFFLLFNPFTYLYPASARAFRLGLSMPLVLAFFATLVGLLIRAHLPLKNKIMWSTLLGLVFSLLWYTREEGIWLLPSLTLFALYFLVINNDITLITLLNRGIVLFWVAIIFLGFKTTFTHLNNTYYGSPLIIELKSPEFQAALGGLMNIEGKGSKRYVPVSKASQAAAFEVSPTFKTLQPYFEEGAAGSQMPSSFYIWVLRDMVRKSGNAESLPQALDFYRKMGEEIQSACDTGALQCLDRKPSIKPIWKFEYNELVPATFWDILLQAVTFRFYTKDEFEYLKWRTTAPGDVVRDYRFVTREKLVPSRWHDLKNYPDYYSHMIVEKSRILTDMVTGYKATVPYLFFLALSVHLLLLAKCVFRKTAPFEAVSGLLVLGGIISLVSVLTYVKITLWPINRPLFSVYPLVLLYISMMFIFCLTNLKQTKHFQPENSL